MTSQELNAQINPMDQRIAALTKQKQDLAGEIARATAERAQLVAEDAPSQQIARFSTALLDLETALAPISDAISHLTAKRDALLPELNRVTAHENLVSARAGYARALEAAVHARAAVSSAIVDFALDVLPPLVAKAEETQVAGRAAVDHVHQAEAPAGVSPMNGSGNWGVDRYEHGLIGEIVQMLDAFRRRWPESQRAKQIQMESMDRDLRAKNTPAPVA